MMTLSVDQVLNENSDSQKGILRTAVIKNPAVLSTSLMNFLLRYLRLDLRWLLV